MLAEQQSHSTVHPGIRRKSSTYFQMQFNRASKHSVHNHLTATEPAKPAFAKGYQPQEHQENADGFAGFPSLMAATQIEATFWEHRLSFQMHNRPEHIPFLWQHSCTTLSHTGMVRQSSVYSSEGFGSSFPLFPQGWMTTLETKLTVMSGRGHPELNFSLTENKTPTLQQSYKNSSLESIKYSLEVVISNPGWKGSCSFPPKHWQLWTHTTEHGAVFILFQQLISLLCLQLLSHTHLIFSFILETKTHLVIMLV